MAIRTLLGAFRNRSFAYRVAPYSRSVSPLYSQFPQTMFHMHRIKKVLVRMELKKTK